MKEGWRREGQWFNVTTQWCSHLNWGKILSHKSLLAWSHQFFKDLGWWSGRALNSRLPAPQTGALPTELTGRSPKQTFFLHAILPILRGAETLDEPLTESAWVASKNIITTHFTKKSTCVVAILTEMKIFQSYRQTGGDKRLEEINKTVLV